MRPPSGRSCKRARRSAVLNDARERSMSSEIVMPKLSDTMEEGADANGAESDEGAGGFPVSRDFHPALSGHPSAAPTAIAAPPPRSAVVVTPPHDSHLPTPHDGGKVR